MVQKSYEKTALGKFYLVPTPIGNLEDITLRSINILKDVSLILAEDTRVAKNLLNYLKIKKNVKSCYKYNELGNFDYVLKTLQEGKDIAYVSDRGTPLISDPGYVVVKELLKNNINIISLPGATAFVPAISASGIEPNHFLFYGFLNNKESYAIKELEKLKKNNFVTIIYEAPHRLTKTLKNILKVYGNINISISREITKMYEEIYRGNVENAIKYYSNPKGEFVIIIDKVDLKAENNYEEIFNEINKLIKSGKTNKDAIKEISNKYIISKNLLYNKFMERKL